LDKNVTIDTIFSLYNEYYKNEIFKNNSEFCPEECDSIKYSSSISHASYPSYNEYLNLLNNSNLISKFPDKNKTSFEDLKRSVLSLKIYYSNLEYTEISQQAKFETWDLVSNLGGILSLFLGLSFLSFFDLFQLIFEVFIVLYDYI
jgi:hypothetical protein